MAKKSTPSIKKHPAASKKKRAVRVVYPPANKGWLREILGIFWVALAVFLIVSLASHRVMDSNTINSCGPSGRWIATHVFHWIGLPGFLVPLAIGLWGFLLFRHRVILRKPSRLIGLAAVIIFSSTLLSIITLTIRIKGQVYQAGGVLGNYLATQGKDVFGKPGSLILSIAFLLSAVLLATDYSYYLTSHRIRMFLSKMTHFLLEKARRWYQRWRERRYYRKQLIEERRAMDLEEIQRSRMLDDEDDAAEDPSDEAEMEALEVTPPIITRSQPVNGAAPSKKRSYDDEEDGPDDDLEPDEDFDQKFVATRNYHYQLPPLSLLEDPPETQDADSEEELIRKSEILVRKLNDFSIQGRVTQVSPGPVITRFEFEPAPGIKISKILSLADDLALAMKSKGLIRIAPIPGKNTLGVEIPNIRRQIVSIKEILSSYEYEQIVQKSLLALPIGKTIAGEPFITDLKRMPHLLIAGATGSGKSVCINAILCGLLFSATPFDLRLLLIDPKMLELSDYNGIPHLREPVITDVKKAPDALNWAVAEMNRRYEKLSMMGARNIDQFNEKVSAPDYDGHEIRLPYLVIIIDELADLMLTTPAVVEESIQRLAQMARASGIHLIIATQRPSVDVITGVIKANLPCRLAFQVASRVDSRTILDRIGAEKLLGLGDSLFMPPTTSQIERLHGCYISDREIKRVVDFLRQQPPPENEESIFQVPVSEQGTPSPDQEDPLYQTAVNLVLKSGLASISFLQRRLKVGHSRASRLIDYMEQSGIVGPHNGSKTRDILVDRDEFLARIEQMNQEEEEDV